MSQMRRFAVLLPIVAVWGCSPTPEAKTSPAPSPSKTAETNTPADPPKNPATPPTTPKTATKDPAPTPTPTPTKPTTPTPTPLPPDIEKPGTNGFKPVTNDAVTALAAVDAQMKRMRDIELTQKVQSVYLPIGKGTAELVSRVKNPDAQLLVYANLEPVGSRYDLVQYKEVRAGGKSQTLVLGKYQPGHRTPSGNVLETWPKNFSQHLVSNFADAKAKTFSDLARAAVKAGWKTAVETKKFDNGSYQRVILTSNTTPKKTYAILIEPNKKLPVELQMDVDGKDKTRVTAVLRWRQSDRPLTAEDLSPSVKTPAFTQGEMGKKPGS